VSKLIRLSGTWIGASLLIGSRRDIRLYAALAVAVAAIFIAYISRMHDITHDAFHEMALAREWFTTGKFPTDDLFAYTPTVSPAVHHEWGTGVVLYWVAALSPLDLDGMILLKMVLVAILGATLYRVARGNGAHPIVFFLLAPIVFPVLWVGFATLRAQLFTLVAIALTMLMLQSDWRGKRGWVVFWIPLYVLWLNMHAGFVVGLGLLGFHFIERLLSTAVKCLREDNSKSIISVSFPKSLVQLVCANHFYARLLKDHWHLFAMGPIIVSCLYLNPWKWQYVWYLVKAISMPRPLILEWQPIWFTYDPLTTLVAFGCSIVLIAYAVSERQWDRLRGCLFCILAAYMALKHIRHGSIYAIIWIAMVPGWITHTSVGKSLIRFVTSTRSQSIRCAWAAAVASICFALFQPFYRATVPGDVAPSAYGYPTGAVDFLAAHRAQGNVMTPFHCGAYVSWRLYPDVKVSLDGRYEVAYEPQVMEQHRAFYAAMDGWQETLTAYQHDYIIIPKDAPVYDPMRYKKLPSASQWDCIYEDEYFALFGKNETLVVLSREP
jgi:hypothetical protein